MIKILFLNAVDKTLTPILNDATFLLFGYVTLSLYLGGNTCIFIYFILICIFGGKYVII